MALMGEIQGMSNAASLQNYLQRHTGWEASNRTEGGVGECKIFNSILQSFHFLCHYQMLSKDPTDPGKAAPGVENLRSEDKATEVSVGGWWGKS